MWHEMGCGIRKGCGMRWGVASDGVGMRWGVT